MSVTPSDQRGCSGAPADDAAPLAGHDEIGPDPYTEDGTTGLLFDPVRAGLLAAPVHDGNPTVERSGELGHGPGGPDLLGKPGGRLLREGLHG